MQLHRGTVYSGMHRSIRYLYLAQTRQGETDLMTAKTSTVASSPSTSILHSPSSSSAIPPLASWGRTQGRYHNISRHPSCHRAREWSPRPKASLPYPEIRSKALDFFRSTALMPRAFSLHNSCRLPCKPSITQSRS